MKPSTDIKPVSFLKAHAAQVLETVRRTGRPMVITQRGEARAVVMDLADYETLKNGVAMLRLLARSEAELQQGKGIPLAKGMRQLKRRLRRGYAKTDP